MKGIWKARIQKKPWIEGSAKCADCVRRSLIEPCRDRCEVIVEYAQRKGLLFIKGIDPKSVFSLSDRSDPTDLPAVPVAGRSDSL
jgi:hypothetical protein